MELVEISTRKTCIYPVEEGNFITISGFYISQAATQWAAPTAEQIGIIATHWNKGWINYFTYEIVKGDSLLIYKSYPFLGGRKWVDMDTSRIAY